MRYRTTRLAEKAALNRLINAARGNGVSVIRMTGMQLCLQTVPLLSALPVEPGAVDLQDADGNFYFLPGYSDPEGDHVVR